MTEGRRKWFGRKERLPAASVSIKEAHILPQPGKMLNIFTKIQVRCDYCSTDCSGKRRKNINAHQWGYGRETRGHSYVKGSAVVKRMSWSRMPPHTE